MPLFRKKTLPVENRCPCSIKMGIGAPGQLRADEQITPERIKKMDFSRAYILKKN